MPRKKPSGSPKIVHNLKKKEPKVPASKVVKKKALVSKVQKIRKPRGPRKNNKKNLPKPLPQELPQILLEKVNIGNFSSLEKRSTAETSKNSNLKLVPAKVSKSSKRKSKTDFHDIDNKSELPAKRQKQAFREAVSESIVEVTQFQIIQPKVEPADPSDGDDYCGDRNIEYSDLIKSESLEDYCTDFSQEQYSDLIEKDTCNIGVNKFKTDGKYFTDCLNITIKQSPDMDIVEHLPNSHFPASDVGDSQYTTLNYAYLKHDTSNDSPNVGQVQSSNAGTQMKKLLDNIKNLLIEFKKEKALYRTASNKENQKLLIKASVEKLQLEISELRAIASNPENSNKNLGKPLEILNGFERFLAKNNFNENYSDDESSKNAYMTEESENNLFPEKTNTVRRDSTSNNQEVKCGSVNSSPNPCINQVEPPCSNQKSADEVNDASTSLSDESSNTEKSLKKSEKGLISSEINPRFTIENVVKPKKKFAIVNVENILLNKSIVNKYNLGTQLYNATRMVSHTSNNESRPLYNTSDSRHSASPLKSPTMEGDHNKKVNKITITVPRITITQDLSKAGNRVVNMIQTKTSSSVPSNFNLPNSSENFADESYMSEFYDECSLPACYWTECYNFSDYEKERILSLDPIFDGATLTHEETIENIRHEINSFQGDDDGIECQNEKTAVFQVSPSIQKTEENHFKVPTLVAAKRPPTRLKNTLPITAVSNPSNLKVIVQVGNTLVDNSRFTSLNQDAYDNTKTPAIHEDDAISLYADSIQSETLNGQDIQFSCKPTNVSSTITTPNVKGDANVNSNTIVNTISTADKTVKLSSKMVDPEKHLNVIQWINNTATAHTSRTSFNKGSCTPPIFSKLCTYYFFKTCIKNFQCKKYHHIPPNIRNSIENLQYDDLTSAYNYIRNSSKLYIETIDFFINGFVNLKCDKQLIVMALDVLDLPIYNKTPVVKKYISALQTFNLTFIEAIGKIVDDSETIIGLSDIILDIICAQSTPEVVENWVVVQKLAKNRGRNLIDHGIVKDIMIKSYIDRNVQLAKYIVDDIISPHIVELKAIQSDKIIKFSRFVSCQLPDQKYSLIDQLREYKVSIDFTKIHCASLFENSCKYHTPRVQFITKDFKNPVYNPSSDGGLSSCSQDMQVEKVIQTDDIKDKDVTIKDDLIKTIDLTHEEKINIKSEPNQATDLDDSFGSNFDSKDHSGSENDLKKLSDIISQGNSLGFLAKLYDFQGTSHSRWFILNSICFFKLKPPAEVYKMFTTVLKGLEQFTSALKESDVGKMFQTLTLNMVIVLAQEKAYNDAARLLLKYYDELDTLIKVEWFVKTEDCDYSEAGKYLLFCKIFTRGGLLQEAVTLLRNSDLKLIYKSETWPMKNHGSNDIEFRNRVLKEVMLKAIETNILIAKDLILFILMEKDHISEINIWKYFNQLIITMLENGETYKEDLKSMIENILEGWYNNLSTLALRGLLVILLKDIPENVASSLYHKCSQKSIYQLIKGNETYLTLKTDMADEEIYMTLQVYFEKAAKRKYQLQDTKDLIIQIALPNTHNEKLHLVINNNSVSEFKTRAYRILASCFSRAIHIESTGCEPTICIKSYQLQSLFTKIS